MVALSLLLLSLLQLACITFLPLSLQLVSFILLVCFRNLFYSASTWYLAEKFGYPTLAVSFSTLCLIGQLLVAAVQWLLLDACLSQPESSKINGSHTRTSYLSGLSDNRCAEVNMSLGGIHTAVCLLCSWIIWRRRNFPITHENRLIGTESVKLQFESLVREASIAKFSKREEDTLGQ